jgi:hypothetical protein
MIAAFMKIYRGVPCKWCGEPIAISQKIETLADRTDTDAPQTFIGRCRACAQENIYTVSNIRNFAGRARLSAPKRGRAAAG